MRSQRDRAIERFAAGRMSASEQEEFLRQAMNDPATGRLVKAEEAITRGVASDRAALPSAPAEPTPRLLAALAASKAPQPVAAGASGSVGAGLSAAWMWKGLMVTVLGIVALVAVPMMRNTGSERTSGVSAERAADAGTQTRLPLATEQGFAISGGLALQGATAATARRTDMRRGIRVAEHTTGRSVPANAAQPTPTPAATTVTTAQRPHGQAHEPAVFEDPVVPIDVRTKPVH